MQQATSLAPAKKTPKNEPAVICLATPAEVRYWMNAFDMSEEQLRLLVRMHGAAVAPIRAALSRRRAA